MLIDGRNEVGMKVKKKNLILFLQVELFMPPSGMLDMKLFNVMWYALLFVLLLYFVITKKRNYLNRIFGYKTKWLLGIYMFTQSICTLLNGGPWLRNIMSLVVVFLMCMFFEEKLFYEKECIISVFKMVLLFNIIAENLLYLLGYSFLGSLTCAYVYYIVWATISLYLSTEKRKNNIEIMIVSILFIITTIIKPQIESDGIVNYEWTFYVIAILYMVFAVGEKVFINFKRFFNGKTFLTIIIMLNLVFVFLSIQDRIAIIRFIVEDIMHKDIGLTGRSGIWDLAKRIIIEKPLYGYGTGLTTLPDGGKWYEFMRIFGPHNQFLYILLAGGIVTLITYIILLVYIAEILNKYLNHTRAMVFCLGLLGMYLELMLTYRTYATCMPLFVLFVIIEDIYKYEHASIKQLQKQANKKCLYKANMGELYDIGN